MDASERCERAMQVLFNLGPMLPGSISEQYAVCGKPGCRCSAAQGGERHGPYHKLSFSLGGRQATLGVRGNSVDATLAMTENYKAARKALNELALASVELYKDGGCEVVPALSAHQPTAPSKTAIPLPLARLAASRDKWKTKAMERKASLERGRVKERDLRASRDKWRDESLAARRSLRQVRESLERKESALAKREAELAKTKEELNELKRKRRAGAADLGGTAT